MIREVFDIYNRNLLQVLIWSMLIIVPVTALCYFSVLYMNDLEGLANKEIYAGWFVALNFVICIPPFLMLVIKDSRDEQVSIKEGILFFLKQFGLLLLASSALYFIAIKGMVAFFIPTVVALLFMLILPFFTETKGLGIMFKRTAQTIAGENISLIGDILIVVSLHIAIWTIIMMVTHQFENSILAYLIFRVVMNLLLFPFIYIYLACRYRGAVEHSLESIEVRGEEF